MIAFCIVTSSKLVIIVCTVKDFQLKEFPTQVYPPKVLSRTILVLQW